MHQKKIFLNESEIPGHWSNALQQLERFKAGVQFAKAEGIIPVPEATHAIAQVIREADQVKLEGRSKITLFNMCGHGFVGMQTYADYFEGNLEDHFFTD